MAVTLALATTLLVMGGMVMEEEVVQAPAATTVHATVPPIPPDPTTLEAGAHQALVMKTGAVQAREVALAEEEGMVMVLTRGGGMEATAGREGAMEVKKTMILGAGMEVTLTGAAATGTTVLRPLAKATGVRHRGTVVAIHVTSMIGPRSLLLVALQV
jgi:hypothetical protein